MGRQGRRTKIKGKVELEKLPSNFFSVFKREALIKADKRNREIAKQTAAKAKEIIRKQQFNWIPLDPEYQDWKKKKGLDKRIYIATKDLVNNGIGWWVKKGFVFVGPKPGKIHKPSGLTYTRLFRFLEFGTVHIPARPLWRPLLSETLRLFNKIQREYGKEVSKHALAQLRRKRKRVRKT